LKYELELAKTKMELEEFNKLNGSSIELRNAESKNFE
jgi:hypothetical protein